MIDIVVVGPPTSQGRILTLDNALCILADPGWNGTDSLDCYNEHILNIDIILLSQTSVHYIGAYIKLLHDHPQLRTVPVYSTLPVSRFGRIAVCELYRSCGKLGAVEDNDIELTDLVKHFNAIKSLNYSQTLHLSMIHNKAINLSLTAYNSGYSIGGSIWLIENNINERIVYAPVWNHAKDEFLNNCKLFNNSDLMRPTTFITNCEYAASKLTHSQRIDKFLDVIQQTLAQGSHVLLPTSLSGRFFELVLPMILHRNLNAKLYLLNYTGLENMKTLANFIEWMNSNLTKIWENEKQSKLVLENNRINTIKYADLKSLDVSTPHIFFMDDHEFVTGSTLSQFVIDMHKKLKFAVILTEQPNRESIMYKFFAKWKTSVDNEGDLVTIDLPKLKLVSVTEKPLRGQELAKYEKHIQERREEAVKTELEELERKKQEEMLDTELKEGEVSDDDDEDDDEAEEEGRQENKLAINSAVSNVHADNIIKIAEIKYQETKSLTDILALPRDFNVTTLKHKHRMFPMVNNKLVIDDYGIVIKHEDFKVYDDDRFPIIKETKDEEGEKETEKLMDSSNKRRKLESSVVHYLDAMNDPVSRSTKKTTLNVKCGFSFVDLSGVHDLRSLKFATQQLKPRKVVILPQINGGDQDQLMNELNEEKMNEILSRSVTKSTLQIEFIKCLLNNTVSLGNVITSYELTLDESLVTNLNWKLLNDEYSVSYVTGKVEKIKDWEYQLHPNPKKSNIATDNGMLTNTKIGDIKLTQLRKLLTLNNHRVELLGDGRLVIDDEIIIVKADEGNVHIQGSLSALFYKVKKVVENMLATI